MYQCWLLDQKWHFEEDCSRLQVRRGRKHNIYVVIFKFNLHLGLGMGFLLNFNDVYYGPTVLDCSRIRSYALRILYAPIFKWVDRDVIVRTAPQRPTVKRSDNNALASVWTSYKCEFNHTPYKCNLIQMFSKKHNTKTSTKNTHLRMPNAKNRCLLFELVTIQC